MNFDTFEKLIKNLQKFSERSSKLYDLGIDVLKYDELPCNIISSLLEQSFGNKGKDWIDWFLYERIPFGEDKEPLKAWDENNNEICYDIPSLWDCVREYLVENKKFAYRHKPTNTWVYFRYNMICLCLKPDCTVSSDKELLRTLLLSSSFNDIENYGRDNCLEFELV